MADDPTPYPEPFEMAEVLWLHAYLTVAERLPASGRRRSPQSAPGDSEAPGTAGAGPGSRSDAERSDAESDGERSDAESDGERSDGGSDGERSDAERAQEADRSAGTDPSSGAPPPAPGDLLLVPAAPDLAAGQVPVPGAEPAALGAGGQAAPAALVRDLRDAPGIARSLRSLRMALPSAFEVELDEEATAEHAAEDGLWLPYVRPTDERRFELVLVVDDNATMVVWQQTVGEVVAAAAQSGAFRDVRVRTMGVRGTAGAENPVLRGPDAPNGPTGAPAELVDGTGRRIVLVLTDGLGPLWRTGAGRRALDQWSAAGPVAVAHLLSQRDWHRTALAPRQARLRSPYPGAPNTRLAVDFAAEDYDPFDPPPGSWTAAVPVVELNADWLGRWAQLVSGEEQGPVDLPALLLGVPDQAADDDLGAPAVSVPPPARELVRRFRSRASHTAFRLATHLAAVVSEPQVIRYVQRTLVPESRPAHLAELFLSGLLRQTPPDTRHTTGGIPLDFVDGAREELLAAAMRSETARVVRSVAESYGDRFEGMRRLSGALLAPGESPVPTVTPESMPFMRVELAVLRALSGPYLQRAERVSAALESAVRGTAPSDMAPGLTKSPGQMVHDVNDQHPISDLDGLVMTDTSASTQHSPDTTAGTTVGQIPAPTVDGQPEAGSPPSRKKTGDTGTGGARLSRPPVAGVPAVWGSVPPKNPNFVGREDLLARVRDQLVTGSTSAVLPHALHGMGGVGKSQIAIEYVYQYASDYDVIWWIPSEQPSMILSALAELAQRLGLDVGNEAITAVPAVREALRSGVPYRNWLLVFDNAENVETVRQYFPNGGTGKILVTSRNQEWDRVARTLSVDIFTREESKSLIRRRARALSDSDADLVASALGDLPLAVEQAAAWLAVTGMPVQDYVGLLSARESELLLDLVPSPDYPMSVAAAWDVSLRRLEESNPAALQFLQVCAFFAPEPIARSLFNNVRNTSIAPELDKALGNPVALGRAIREVGVYSLARIEHRHNTIQLHRLVQAVLVQRMSQQQQADMRHGAHLLLADANPNSPRTPALWPRYQALLPHVLSSRAVECDSPWVRNLVRGMVNFLDSWGDTTGAAALAREAREIWTAKFGAEDPQTLQMSTWLGYILRRLGQYEEAMVVMEHTADVYVRTAGEDEEETLDARIQFSNVPRLKADFKRGLEINKDVYDRALRAFGEDDPITLRAAHSLGVGLRLAGHFSEALELDQKTVRLRALVLGENSSETLLTMGGLSIDMREAGDYLGAVEYEEKAYEISCRVFSPEHPTSAGHARILSVCRRRAGDHAGALQLGEIAYAQFESRNGAAHPDSVACAANLIVDLRQDGQLERSRDIGEKTIERYVLGLGADYPYTLSARTNLAITLRQLGDLDGAEEQLAQALPGFRAKLGDEHVFTLTAILGMASLDSAKGRHAEALKADERTMKVLTRLFGEEHPTTLACANNMALDLRALGRADEANALQTETLARYRRKLGEGHPATISAASSQRAEVDIAPVPF
ncbi:FxSxx-COOH system tetratricopeptide repeat protein [Actinacidiphila sp. ITFR-21]|uniref:FxSxx-COOH system tetratricopeptide repeat protein n=1 Tax=Actinacidiphila sp. ITFR-21 TaxID=3075199 RepID=UPI00288A222B|nr:FxSxx-COOH system tetratricopeptide repeat protein [Streptomyces sp. ITFR-21]WNI16428.1 FxSxx-COOH system tetratricopeptide repeat protein [Streptomyces sp. ITFR-21]